MNSHQPVDHFGGSLLEDRSARMISEPLIQLDSFAIPRAPMPPAGGWAMEPEGLAQLLSLVCAKRPELVVELGSGTSSIWLGYCLEQWGGRLVSVDHLEQYGSATRANIAAHALDETVEVRISSLTDVCVDGERFSWYGPRSFAGLDRVGLLLVDGPPASTGPEARYPALPLLVGRLAPSARVVLDDLLREDEQRIAERWLRRIDGLFLVTRESGVGVFAYTSPLGCVP
jgi:hypothetical protein